MNIIPVLDILNGIAVHAIRGERNKYQPLKSILSSSSESLELAKAFDSFGFNELYMADLDAITKNDENFSVYSEVVSETNLSLMIDAGINDLERAMKVFDAGASNIIIGTETLTDLDFVQNAIQTFSEDSVIVSIDLKEGELLTKSKKIKSMEPLQLVNLLEDLGVARIIILDLSRVGSKQGSNMELAKKVLAKTNVKVIIGGGVKDLDDLIQARELGISAALVATVLHSGNLTKTDLKLNGFL
jgi:phosphoribosylformimino-5-aminoimidazole carboxamide ribotide isomerase